MLLIIRGFFSADAAGCPRTWTATGACLLVYDTARRGRSGPDWARPIESATAASGVPQLEQKHAAIKRGCVCASFAAFAACGRTRGFAAAAPALAFSGCTFAAGQQSRRLVPAGQHSPCRLGPVRTRRPCDPGLDGPGHAGPRSRAPLRTRSPSPLLHCSTGGGSTRRH